jgi:UDP-N-acetylmuramyl pentapeptide phosphotransferase/UDP-N-acetylglucosamine-1-phosphate transferase
MRVATDDADQWQRSNYRGARVSLAGGPTVAIGALTGAANQSSAAAFACGASAAVLGLYDDLYGDSHARGLGGHVRALSQGRVTTGMVKLSGLVTAAALTSALEHRRPGRIVTDAMLVAGCANLVNLLDLRPGRALKSVAAAGAVTASREGVAGAVAAACAGAAVAALPADLNEEVMIGDCGANALGAMLGWSIARGFGATGRAVALTAVIAMTLVSERVSFTAFIEATPWLRALDEWGRQG